MALQRRPRIRCQLRCEIVQGKTRTDATVVTLSEGGLGVRTELDLEEGDDARIRLLPEQGSNSITVRGLVWNTAGRRSRRIVGFVVSDPPPGFVRMVRESVVPEPPREAQRGPGAAVRRPATRPASESNPPLEVVREEPHDPALPRPRDPMPLPKPDPLETLPLFRVRVKQVSGSRSRWLEIRARSLQDCGMWVRRNLEGEWEILELARIDKGVG